MEQSTIRECTEADRKMMDHVGEIQDGLFVFIEQGSMILDCAAFFCEKDGVEHDLYILTVYKRKDVESRSLFNFSHVGKDSLGDIDYLMDEYDDVETLVADNREDMLSKFIELCTKHNHF